jgi:hypothetical protein
MSDSELRGDSPRPSRLRTDRLAPVSKFDYVLMHTRFMRFCKLSSFGGRRVERSLTSPAVMYTGIVYRSPTDSPACGIAWKTCTRGRCDPTRLFDRCRELWSLICVVLLGFSHAWCKLIRISTKSSDMDDTCLLQSFRRRVIPPMFI